MTKLLETLDAQKRAARAAPSSASERVAKLKALRHQLERYQDLFADAASADFGNRPHFESRLIEVIGTLWVLDHARRNPEVIATASNGRMRAFLSSSAEVNKASS